MLHAGKLERHALMRSRSVLLDLLRDPSSGGTPAGR